MKKQFFKKLIVGAAVTTMLLSLAGCGGAKTTEGTTEVSGTAGDGTEVYVFIAASLAKPMEELEASFEEANPGIDILYNADSSGKLMTQIEEGADCDIFFSAGMKQMNELVEKDFAVEGDVIKVLKNNLVVVGSKSNKTEVTGLSTLGKGKLLAICDGTVPAGRYTRLALLNAGMIDGDKDTIDQVTTAELMDKLGTEISEQSNVSKALAAVAEGSCDAGTVYYSDTYGYEDSVEIIEHVSTDLTGDIIYPVSRIANKSADEKRAKAADSFVNFIRSDEAKAVFEKYYFETVE